MLTLTLDTHQVTFSYISYRIYVVTYTKVALKLSDSVTDLHYLNADPDPISEKNADTALQCFSQVQNYVC